MRKIKKLCQSALCIIVCSMMLQTIKINAGGISVSASPSSVEVGQQFTISVSASGVFVEGLSISCSGCTLLSNINNTVDTGETKTATARLDSEGGATVTVSGTAASYDVDANEEFGVSGSAYVSAKKKQSTPKPNTNNGGSSNQTSSGSQVNPPANEPVEEPKEDTRSKDNNLASLTLSQGNLSPSFSSNTTSYKVDLPADADKITIEAKAKDSKAIVSGTGEKKLKAGKNEYTVTVTAENGSTKSYKIEVTVDEKPLVYTAYNGVKLGVVRNTEDIKVPNGFKETKVKIEDKDVIAWANEKINKTILYLSDEKDNKSFYLYEEGKVTSTFEYRKMLGKEFYVIDVPADKQTMTGMKYQKITIDETEINGWVFEDKEFENYAVIYVMDMNGNMAYYQYEKTQNTLQLYSGAAAISQNKYDEQSKELDDSKQLNTILICSCVVLGLLTIGTIGYIIYNRKHSRKKSSRLVNNMLKDED